MNDSEKIVFEDRTYVNPDVSRNEQLDFINTFRDLQEQNNQQIATETHSLGTDVTPEWGGLSGSGDYWKSKYQTPQTDALVANMKANAQQTALNTAMSNYNDMLENRYNQAYRAYQDRVNKYETAQRRKSNYSSSGSSSYTTTPTGNVNYTGDDYVEASSTENKNPKITNSHYVYWLGDDGNVWMIQNGNTFNLGKSTGNLDSGYAEGSKLSMAVKGTRIAKPN